MSLPPFQHLVDAYWHDVGRLAHALAGPTAAEDVAQQAWTQAFAAYPRLRRADNLRGWLLTITHRCAMDHHRQTARAPQPADPQTLPDSPSSPLTDPNEALWADVARLPHRQREAIVLRYVADLDHRAIAAALDTTPAMSRRLVSDALAALRKARP